VTVAARAAIDAANRGDPSEYDGEPLALAQGRLAEEWVTRLHPEASAALRLAARAHHLRRWTLPRESFPPGRQGYLRWRREQKARHARDLEVILESAGVAPSTVARAATIVTKRGLGTDPEVQVFEDAVCLTFLVTQLVSTADKLADDAKMVDVVAKTLAKMSEAGRVVAVGIDLDERGSMLVSQAIAQLEGEG
jgi:hypothetical protein